MMILIAPLALLVYLCRNRLVSFLKRFSLPFAFIVSGTVFGLLTELFAILDNMKKPVEERILMSPYPLTDFFYGIFYYGLVVSIWYFLLKRYAFSKKEIFFITGIVLGVGTEQMGKIFFAAISSVTGFLVACLIVIVYGTFPVLAYLVTEGRFSLERKITGLKAYLVAAVCLVLQWALFGAVILPFLKMLG